MKVTFKSKMGLELIVPLVILLGAMAILFCFKGIWPGLIIILSVSVFIVYTFLNTFYTIDEDRVEIRCGLFFNKFIAISSIRKVSETRSILSSPATSSDRLEISYNKFDSIMISPKNKKEFIKHLVLINSNIEVV